MADLKISQLTSATLPLAGTEVLPIVQSSTTKKVATDDLTVKNFRSNATTGILQIAGPAAAATRTMTVPDANFTAARIDASNSFTSDQTLATGNLIQGTAAKGVNFTANTPAAGMTSQLLNWYEEGIVNAVLTDGTNDATMSSDSKMFYTRIGRMVFVQGYINVTNLGSVTGPVLIKGLPFTVNGSQGAAKSALAVGQAGGLAITASETVNGFATPGDTTIDLRIWNATTGATQLTAAQFTASGFISFSIAYPV